MKDEIFSETSMIPMTRSSAPTSNLVEYWNEARLRVASAKSTSVRPAPGIVPWRSALEDVLKVGYGLQAQPRFVAGAWQEVRWRTTPSAGALYPFEVIASVVGEGSYLWDIEKGRLIPCDAPPLARDALAEAGLVTRPGHRLEALLIFVARPWLSMKKYRLRGYAYCHLDVGHTATNLALYTAALGHDPVLHLRFSRTCLAEHLKLDGLCREPLAVLSYAAAETLGDPHPAAAPGSEPLHQGTPAVGLELPGPQEIQGWESLQGVLSYDFALQSPCGPSSAPLVLGAAEKEPAGSLVPLPDGRPPFLTAAEWRSAILGRRSAKGFRPEPVSLADLGELLGALRAAGLPADCSLDGFARLGVRLVARNVDGLAGVFAYAAQEHALRQIDAQADDPRPACMQQGLAGHAAALVILHAPLWRLLDSRGYSAFAELHFRAAELGQRLHLAATRLGAVGITCIGGFDGDECAHLARLDAGEEAIYVILIGVRDESVFKHDQLNVAWSHGHTTTLEE
jgi:SagB-type dehydrogenase family enzyme